MGEPFRVQPVSCVLHDRIFNINTNFKTIEYRVRFDDFEMACIKNKSFVQFMMVAYRTGNSALSRIMINCEETRIWMCLFYGMYGVEGVSGMWFVG